ncbi:MAG: YjjI family glycine radical enzyme [Chloroflexi bacterium]|nr:YjjI family glycine radical enzyme [Chloroflexota bacterium]
MTRPSTFYSFEDFENGLTADTLDDFKTHVRSILTSHTLLEDQQEGALQDAAFKCMPYPKVSAKAQKAVEEEVICLLNEGPAPFHPRYTAPDYGLLLRQGSAFMDLKPAVTLYDATASLLTAYHYVPNGLPVFIGRLDELLDPYVTDMPEDQAQAVLRSFWLLVDRLYPNAFVHADIGPKATKAGCLLLQAERELKTITNVTLRYDPAVTGHDFALLAVENALQLSKPYFLNHARMVQDWGDNYVIASCYNAMRPGGGIHTLVRLNLKRLASQTRAGLEAFLDEVIPQAARLQAEVIESRIRYLVEEVGWFEKDIFLQEGLLQRDRFSAYAGIFGLAEAVQIMMERAGMPEARYGHHPAANEAAARITQRMEQEVNSLPQPYCEGTGGHACLHAQVGIDNDLGVTPGCRVPAGTEPDLYAHLLAELPSQQAVQGGISTILEFDQTAAGNPQAVLDIIHGAFSAGIRNLSIGSTNSEYIRVTGYLIRRADLEAKQKEKALRHDSSLNGTGFIAHQQNTLHRRMRTV